MKPRYLFSDLGGVLLSNGWDRQLRNRVAEHFQIDAKEMEDRHQLTYDTYERGYLDVETYLRRIIFEQPRPYTWQQVLDYILEQGRPLQETIDLVRELKKKHGLRVGVISNEGREIGEDRVRRFALGEFVDFFVISGCVGFRKPDAAIFRLALDVAQARLEESVYLEDRSMFVDVATSLGLRTVWHRDAASTRAALAAMGLD